MNYYFSLALVITLTAGTSRSAYHGMKIEGDWHELEYEILAPNGKPDCFSCQDCVEAGNLCVNDFKNKSRGRFMPSFGTICLKNLKKDERSANVTADKKTGGKDHSEQCQPYGWCGYEKEITDALTSCSKELREEWHYSSIEKVCNGTYDECLLPGKITN